MPLLKTKIIYRCSQCDHETLRWLGQCPQCQAWNSLIEESKIKAKFGEYSYYAEDQKEIQSFQSLYEAESNSENKEFSTGFPLLDNLLGGGLKQGSFLLIGGPPGVGKSTLVSQIAGYVTEISQKSTVLMVSGEEEPRQVADRLKRIGIKKTERLLMISHLGLENIIEETKNRTPSLLVVDSVQTIASHNLIYPIGSPAAIRSTTFELLRLSKQTSTTIILLGHVTKDGLLAGPKHMEHMVDQVLMMEKPRAEEYRILRINKNRFGPTDQLLIFSMTKNGLQVVEDPSQAFLSQEWLERLNQSKKKIGLASSIALDGGQCFLIQAEALIGKKKAAPGRRASLGVERGRFDMIVAMLEKVLGISLEYSDVYMSLLGGIKVRDPGVDLSIAMAIVSAALDAPVLTSNIYLGELTLSGEILKPKDLTRRINQAHQLGFDVVHAANNLWHIRDCVKKLKEA